MSGGWTGARLESKVGATVYVLAGSRVAVFWAHLLFEVFWVQHHADGGDKLAPVDGAVSRRVKRVKDERRELRVYAEHAEPGGELRSAQCAIVISVELCKASLHVLQHLAVEVRRLVTARPPLLPAPPFYRAAVSQR